MLIYCTNKEKFNKYISYGALVLFNAEWCQACQKFTPFFIELSKEQEDNLFLIIDVDQNKELVKELKINNIPKLIHFKNSKKIRELKYYSKEGLIKFGKT